MLEGLEIRSGITVDVAREWRFVDAMLFEIIIHAERRRFNNEAQWACEY